MLAKLLRTYPERLLREVAYFRHPGHAAFERTYGWAWLLRLGAELADWDAAEARAWSSRLQPLADAVMERARTWFLEDGSALTAAEPGGEDFLSPCLEEAALMARILPARGFRTWAKPWLTELRGSPVLVPAQVSDRTDPRIVHLDRLNLSRARALQALAASLGPGEPMAAELERAARDHGAATLPQVGSGLYVGEHWLGTFAVRLLEAWPPAAATRAPARPS
jgi:hypothetical protein